jgi:hypothetical protein
MDGTSGSAEDMKPAGTPAPSAGGPGEGRRRTWLVVGLATFGIVLLALAGWSLWGFLGRASVPGTDAEELRALDARLTLIDNTLRPIAISFTSQPETAPIDVTSYRDKIAKARKVVESVNDLPTTSATSLEIRDAILTGGTQVLDGMSSALDALESNDASGTEGASAQVEEGLTQLDEARTRLQELLGTPSDAQGDRRRLARRLPLLLRAVTLRG